MSNLASKVLEMLERWNIPTWPARHRPSRTCDPHNFRFKRDHREAVAAPSLLEQVPTFQHAQPSASERSTGVRPVCACGAEIPRPGACCERFRAGGVA